MPLGMPAPRRDISLKAAGEALLVRAVYALNGIILSFYVYQTLNEPRIFILNCLLLPSIIEVVATLKYKKRAEWTWFIPSVFIYLLWVVPSILLLEISALKFRAAVHQIENTRCHIVFFDDQGNHVTVVEENQQTLYHTVLNGTTIIGTPESHDLSRRYSMLFQQIMMLVIIFGRWLAPKGKLTRDQLSSLLLALTAMTIDMLEFFTDSLGIEAVACDKVYVGFIMFVWCWSLLQVPLGLTAVKERRLRVVGQPESRDNTDGVNDNDMESDEDEANRCDWRSYISCCCESEIWSLLVSICMQDGPYLILRLYIIFSANFFGETIIFFSAKNAIVVLLQLYRVYAKFYEMWKAQRAGTASGNDSPNTRKRNQNVGDVHHQGSCSALRPEESDGDDATNSENVSGFDNDIEAQLVTAVDEHDGKPATNEIIVNIDVADSRKMENETDASEHNSIDDSAAESILTVIDDRQTESLLATTNSEIETEENHHLVKRPELRDEPECAATECSFATENEGFESTNGRISGSSSTIGSYHPQENIEAKVDGDQDEVANVDE